ncbi:MAG: sugar phosphate isomerase/epimerase family protein [Planctomycetota bacterium]|jgi:L-ribulose-5-phosphate 3-epimerase|nr:sugar phosphate isomerase/epimerase [Blastopirellula sp.]
MLLGYNTNGLAHHDPQQALELLAEIGYRSVALTIDHQWLSPFQPDWPKQLEQLAQLLRQLGLACTLETGARFLLDPRRKHWPPLVIEPALAAPRRELIRHAMEIAAPLGAKVISIWSGVASEGLDDQMVLDNLTANLDMLLRDAERYDVILGFEPEPGMAIDTMSRWERLQQWLSHPRLRLTLDIGHLFCQGEVPLADYIERWAAQTVNIHLEDMRAGVHEHLMFGEGEMSFPPIVAALKSSGYTGPVHVELSRHSHDAANVARRAFDFLQPLLQP